MLEMTFSDSASPLVLAHHRYRRSERFHQESDAVANGQKRKPIVPADGAKEGTKKGREREAEKEGEH